MKLNNKSHIKLNFEKHLQTSAIGQTIVRVTYYELNRPKHAFFFNGFDNFDLAIEFELSNGFCWHLGWRESDIIELKEGNYLPQEHHSGYTRMDASSSWSSVLNSCIRSIETQAVPGQNDQLMLLTFHFEESASRTIVLAEGQYNLRKLQLPLQNVEINEFYVFDTKDLPPINTEDVLLIDEEKPIMYSSFDTQRIVGFILLLLILIVVFIKYGLDGY